MTATPALTTDLQQQVRALVEDLRKRVDENPELRAQWQQEHRRANEKERTAASWVEWRDDRIDQVAVAWVLTSVFIRFCEDNALVKPVWITGPGKRRQEALDAQREFFQKHPESTDREWLMDAIDYLGSLPATKALVDTHSALRWISPSGDAVTELLKFWRGRSDDGALTHDLQDDSLSTRFLGDQYQDLSAYAQDRYALRQTPIFVEEFILDRTLDPALRERSLEGFRMIDPTCGSGHFLLSSFERLLDEWHKHAPNLEIQAMVQSALDAIHGVDLNPFAVAIARFRLTVAALKACGLRSLEEAPAFKYHLAVGDSLIHGPDAGVLPGMEDRGAYMPFHYATEDAPLLLEILEEGQYDAVVGNPPYITPRDRALNKLYRSKFIDICKGKYSLSVPFIAQFFALAKRGEQAGWVGQITSNSFMKRDFGSKLIEDYLPRYDLRFVIDSEGAWIPGHNAEGTPTVILVAKNSSPENGIVRTVLSKGKRETSRNGNEGEGPYWQAIVQHIEDDYWDDEWVTITGLDRSLLSTHPWSLSGGGAVELLRHLEESTSTVSDLILGKAGFASFTGFDDAFFAPLMAFRRTSVPHALVRPVITGDDVRDWTIVCTDWALVPYDPNGSLIPVDMSGWGRRQWPLKVTLNNITGFGGVTRENSGEPWWSWYRWVPQRYQQPLSITFAFVASHNHFAVDLGGRAFNHSAPVLKLPGGSTKDDYITITGLLNSSVACFWLKRKSQPKGGAADYTWSRTYEFTSTTVQEFPVPDELPRAYSLKLDQLAHESLSNTPSAIAAHRIPTREALDASHAYFERTRSQMIAIQEELDWEVYRLYGIINDDLTYRNVDLPDVNFGERAFEIDLARKLVNDEDVAWFSEHDSAPVGSVPEHWPTAYRDLVKRRIDLIEGNAFIRLLERPECKRRWSQEPWENHQERALRGWLLDRLEDRRFWFDASGNALPKSVGQLADEVARDKEIVSVLALWVGRPDVPVTDSLVRLLENEAVPFLAAYRYKDSGLRKREAWEETWAKQRREDAGEKIDDIQIPPKYTAADFRQPSYSRARGKLDVPKERFTLYLDAGREGDSTPLLGWAGWDHAQQALALAAIIQEREQEGWDDERLVPLVAGLAELQPWVEQWHTEVIPEYAASYAEICRTELDQRAAQVGKTVAELAAWRPAAPARGRKKVAKG